MSVNRFYYYCYYGSSSFLSIILPFKYVVTYFFGLQQHLLLISLEEEESCFVYSAPENPSRFFIYKHVFGVITFLTDGFKGIEASVAHFYNIIIILWV